MGKVFDAGGRIAVDPAQDERTWADDGCVYFLHAPAAGLVKIGWTGDHPDSRYALIRPNSPVELVKLGIVPGPIQVERAIHRHFRQERQEYEWFRYDDRVARWIDRIKHPWPDRYQRDAKSIWAEIDGGEAEWLMIPPAAVLLDAFVTTIRKRVVEGRYKAIRDDAFSPWGIEIKDFLEKTNPVRRRIHQQIPPPIQPTS